MENPFEFDAQRYQSQGDNIHARDPLRRATQRRLAAIIGFVAIGMPILLALGGSILSIYGHGEFRKSLSGFYYEEVLLGDIFVGCLIFIGTAMFAYQGWHRKIRALASFAGICAFLVALFPADGWLIVEDGSQIFKKQSDLIHLIAAAVLFGILAWFCFFVFTRAEQHQRDENGALIPTKRSRNRLYQFAGSIIILSMVVMAITDLCFPDISKKYRVTYWGETVALIAFGTSWLVQGRIWAGFMQDPRDAADMHAADQTHTGV